MPRACAICVHVDKHAIEKQLRSGTPYRNVAEQYGVSLGALSRHHANAHTPTTTPLPTATPKTRNGTVKRNRPPDARTKSSVLPKNTHAVPHAVPLSRPQWKKIDPDAIYLLRSIADYYLHSFRWFERLVTRMSSDVRREYLPTIA